MVKSIEEYRKEITRQMKALKIYSRGLDMQISSLASAMRNLELANREIDSLETTTVYETTRYGQKMAPHPAFKIAKDAQDMITRQMKALGLTAEELTGTDEDDPLIDLTNKVKNSGRKKPIIIKRISEGEKDDGRRKGPAEASEG